MPGHAAASGNYACPDCKTLLDRCWCPQCGFQFPDVDGVPHLLSRDPKFERTRSIASAYDSIYTAQSGVWENQGRTPEFIRYFSSLLEQLPGARSLEIGCGEGFLLASRSKGEKFAVDLSLQAIRQARTRAQADFSLALAERLPFPAERFDLVVSVGVMEHFLDTEEALREIRRVLRPGGHYVSLVHVRLTPLERLGWAVREFLFPHPRPVRLARWLWDKSRRVVLGHGPALPEQPIQNSYTTGSALRWLTRSGFSVSRVLHKRANPELPLIGPSVVIYVARK